MGLSSGSGLSNAGFPATVPYLTITQTGWSVAVAPPYGRSTPENSLLRIGGIYDEVGGASVNYQWGMIGYITNGNSMPVTVVDAQAIGYKVRGGSFTARQVGGGGDAHALEILVGQWNGKATATRANGSAILTNITPTFDGSRFCVGDTISGTGIPGATTIVSVTKDGVTATGSQLESASEAAGGTGYAVDDELTLVGGTFTRPAKMQVLTVSGGAVTSAIVTDPGDYSVTPSNPITTTTDGAGTGCQLDAEGWMTGGYAFPDSITMSANATSSGTSTITAQCATDTQNIGVLISGSGDGGSDGTGNPDGRAIQFQSYGSAAFKYGLNFSGSAIRTDGTVFRVASASPNRVVSLESSTVGGDAFYTTGCTITGSLLNVRTTTAGYGLRFQSDNTFTFAAIWLEGQNIGTDTTTGMKIGTNSNQKIGFFGRTPIVRRSAGTAALTNITHTSPGTPDYSITTTNASAFGASTADEFNTLLSVVRNLQIRVDELEADLKAYGFRPA